MVSLHALFSHSSCLSPGFRSVERVVGQKNLLASLQANLLVEKNHWVKKFNICPSPSMSTCGVKINEKIENEFDYNLGLNSWGKLRLSLPFIRSHRKGYCFASPSPISMLLRRISNTVLPLGNIRDLKISYGDVNENVISKYNFSLS